MSTSQYLAKVKKQLEPHGISIEQFKQNPAWLMKVSKSYESYIINKYKHGQDFKWWNRHTNLYSEFESFSATGDDNRLYISNLVASSPTLKSNYGKHLTQDVEMDEEIDNTSDFLEATEPLPGIYFFFVYRHPQ